MMHRHCTELVIVVVCLAALSAAFQSTKSVDKSAEHLQRHQHTDAVHKKRFDEKEPLKPSSDSDTYDDEADGDGEAADANVGSDGSEENPSLPLPGTYIPSNCSTCARREELRRRSLEVIKDQILNKLGMQQAPNITGRLPPRIPPLDHLLDMYGMQGDAPGGPFQAGPVYDEEEDDFHARTEKVIAFAQQRESRFSRTLSRNAETHLRKSRGLREIARSWRQVEFPWLFRIAAFDPVHYSSRLLSSGR